MADFAETLNGIVNNGLTALAMALGNELGLFDVLCHHFLEPATIPEIATEADLKPRYVQEWLGAMVAASIVEVTKVGDVTKYIIPVEHRNKVILAAKKSTAIPLLAKREQRVRRCFHRTGPNGFRYNDFPEIFEWMSSVNDVTMPEICDTDLLPSLDEDMITLMEKGSWVVDIGCGTGELIIHLARKFRHSSFIGIDSSADALHKAGDKAVQTGICNVTWQQSDAINLPGEWISCFDLVIMYEVLHDFASPTRALAEVRRILKPRGCLTIVEPGLSSKHEENVGDHSAAASYTYSMFSCLPSCLVDSETGDSGSDQDDKRTCGSDTTRSANPGLGIDNASFLLNENGYSISFNKRMTSNPDCTILVCRVTPESKMTDTEIDPNLEETDLRFG